MPGAVGRPSPGSPGWSSATSIRLSLAYFATSILLLHLYGTEVCPFLESLSPAESLTVLSGAFGIAVLLKRLLEPVLIDRAALPVRPFRQGCFEFSLYLFLGLLLTAFNTVVFGFPVGSGLRLTAGFVTIGLFAAIDVALWRQRAEFELVARAATPVEQSMSVTGKLLAGFVASLILSGVVIVLTVSKDVDFAIRNALKVGAVQAKRLVMLDVVFTVSVVMGLGVRVLTSFARNLRILFDAQMTTLASIRSGRLDVHVPVMSADEFALIAERTNEMIDGLREKERIKSTLGKVVSPEVARRLLAASADALREGQRMDVAILFCDLRDFTAMSENVRPEEVVRLLNRYFTEMVGAIEQEGGLVDKFIGDAILAVFGLDGSKDACHAAVRAARGMVERADRLVRPDETPLVNGVGIHFGPAVAGAIGAPQRFEYTVIGDTVNAASRIESLCKQLDRRMLVSADVRRRLPDRAAHWLDDVGAHTVKGRAQPVSLYGLRAGLAADASGGS